MTKIATGYIALKAEVDDLKRDLAKAEAKLEQSTRAMQSNAEKAGGGFKKMWALYAVGAGVALAAGYKVLSVARESVDAFERQRKAVAGLDTVLRSMGRYTPELSSGLQEMAESLQQVTNYGDEATLEGVKFLATYKDITDQLLPRSIRAMQDLAALMGGGPQGLVRAANMLGKASMGMTGELRRVGVTVDQATYQAEGYLGVLKQIEMQVSGQAQALADPWSQLGNVIGDAKENLGGLISIAFEDYAKDMIGLLGEVNESFQTLNERIQETKRVFVESQIRMYESALETSKVMMDLGGLGADFAISLNPEDIEIYTQKLAKLREELAAIQGTGLGGGGAGGGKNAAADEALEQAAEIAAQKQMFFDQESDRIKEESAAYANMILMKRDQDATRLEDIEMAKEAELEMLSDQLQRRLQMETETERAIQALKMTTAQQTYGALMAMGQAYEAWTGKKNKTLFRLEQAMAIAIGLIKTYQAANEALASPPGPPWTIPLAVAITAMGLANVATIAAQKVGGGTVGGGGAAPVATTPAANPLAPATTPLIGGEEQRHINIYFEGGVITDKAFMEDLAEKLSDLVEGSEVRLVSSETRAT